MTGMLQALPKTPLHERVAREGRLVEESRGDQFAFSNIDPLSMSRLELYEGYRRLVRELYDFERYRRRTLGFLMERGDQVHGGRNVRRGDLALFGKVLRETLWRGGPRRAWFTLRLLAAVAWRRPSVFKEAVSFALVHKAFADYVDALGRRLDQAIEEMATSGGSEPGAALERG
jgi:hypothetical protein